MIYFAQPAGAGSVKIGRSSALERAVIAPCLRRRRSRIELAKARARVILSCDPIPALMGGWPDARRFTRPGWEGLYQWRARRIEEGYLDFERPEADAAAEWNRRA